MAVVQTKVPSSESRRRMGIFWDIIFELQAGLEKSTSPTPGASENFCLASE